MFRITKSRLAGKNLVIFFYSVSIVFSLLLLVGCNSNENNGVNNPPINIPDTLGNVTGYINSIDGPVEDVYITLDNKTTFSDSNGFFEFKDCLKKNLVLTISHPEFSEYSNSINITDSLNLSIGLTRTKYDYFPLKVGNQWKFHWVNVWYASEVDGGRSAGTIDWQVVSVAGIFPNFLFKIKETHYDSTYNSSTEAFIDIHTNISDSIIVSGSSYIIKSPSFRRFYPTNFQDTVYVFGYQNSSLKLKRMIGVIDCNYGMGGITYGSFTNIEILSYDLH